MILLKMELSTSTSFSQPNDQNAVDINKVYDLSVDTVVYNITFKYTGRPQDQIHVSCVLLLSVYPEICLCKIKKVTNVFAAFRTIQSNTNFSCIIAIVRYIYVKL